MVNNILISGGEGFLGSHFCERLLANGHEVLRVANFFKDSKTDVKHLLGNPRFELIRHDVTFTFYVEVDEIYNLTCPTSPVHYLFDPLQTTKSACMAQSTCLG